jgi:hypothetical protein
MKGNGCEERTEVQSHNCGRCGRVLRIRVTWRRDTSPHTHPWYREWHSEHQFNDKGYLCPKCYDEVHANISIQGKCPDCAGSGRFKGYECQRCEGTGECDVGIDPHYFLPRAEPV